MQKHFARLTLLVLLFGFGFGCATRRPAPLEPPARQAMRPVLLVPGFTGSKLHDPTTGKPIWGAARRFLFPRDGGYSLVLPIEPAARDAQGYEVHGVVRRVRLGPFSVDIYGRLLDFLTANGYHLGDLDDPKPGDTLFVFPYDWRANNVDVAATLVRKLERLKRVRGEGVLSLDVICHSNAARIARYAMKYGGAPLEHAETGQARPPAWLHVDKLLLVGTANGGSTNGFRNFLEGRSYVPLIGRRFRPEVAFTLDAAFEALPVYRTDLFIDENGQTLDIDLFDAANWKRFGWSVFDERARRRLLKRDRPDLFGTEQQRFAHLERNLDRARRFHSVLRRDVPDFTATRYYLIQNAYRETSDRVLLLPGKQGAWRTAIFPHKRVRGDDLRVLATTPGDGHAPVLSQHWLSPQERDAVAREPLYVRAYHRTIIHHPTTHRTILKYLSD